VGRGDFEKAFGRGFLGVKTKRKKAVNSMGRLMMRCLSMALIDLFIPKGCCHKAFHGFNSDWRLL
jgi:hypothetical protein